MTRAQRADTRAHARHPSCELHIAPSPVAEPQAPCANSDYQTESGCENNDSLPICTIFGTIQQSETITALLNDRQ
jgi:hypothetical protein